MMMVMMVMSWRLIVILSIILQRPSIVVVSIVAVNRAPARIRAVVTIIVVVINASRLAVHVSIIIGVLHASLFLLLLVVMFKCISGEGADCNASQRGELAMTQFVTKEGTGTAANDRCPETSLAFAVLAGYATEVIAAAETV